MAEAMNWVSRITVIGVEMVLFGIAGQWADQRFHTTFLRPIGFLLGLTVAGYHLFAIVQRANRKAARSVPSQRDPEGTTPDPQSPSPLREQDSSPTGQQ